MKTRNWGKTILAVLLAVMMILPSLAVSAEEGSVEKQYKLEKGKVYVYDTETGEWVYDKEKTDYLYDTPWGGGLLGVTAIDVGDQSEEVSGSVKATVTSDSADCDTDATGAAVSAFGEQPADLKVGQDIEASATAGNDSGSTAHVNTIGVMAYSSGEDAEMNVSVGGDVKATAESDSSADAYAVQLNTDGGKIGIEIAGEASAEAIVAGGKADAYGVLVFEQYTYSDEPTVSATEEITAGSVKATATVEGGEKGYAKARAVGADAIDGQTINVTVDGPVEATATNNAENALFTEATAVDATASGEGAKVTVTVSGDMSAIAKETDEFAGASANGVRLTATEGGTVTFTAADSNITATAEAAYSSAEAVKLNNGGGDISAEIVGNVTASGDNYNAGVVVQSTPSSKKEGEFEKGNTDLTVTGDVSADIGVELAIDEVQTANITVDGTVEGETAGIVLSADTKLSDDITMTVWEVKPNKDGAVVAREEWNKEKDELIYTEDKEAEKLIQYIIKVEDTSKDYITTDGTKAFTAGNGNEYQVAHEGDKVLVKLNIPEGKELVDAFWDAAKSQAGRLLKDAEGNYYLEVPRGGGVLLSVTLKDVPKQESKGTAQTAEAKPYAYVLAPILKVRDQTGMVEIDFYRNKRFIVKLEHGGQEEGTFRTEDGILILKCADETEFSFDMGEGEVVYITRDSTGKHYTFKLEPKELDILLKLK